MNLYAYVGNSPVVLSDPLGLQDISPETAEALGLALQTAIDFGLNQADYYVGMYDRAREIRSEAWRRYPNQMGPDNVYRHRWASYQLTQEYGTGNARFAGFANEGQGLGWDVWSPISDVIHGTDTFGGRFRGEIPWGFSPEDLLANEQGIALANEEMGKICPN